MLQSLSKLWWRDLSDQENALTILDGVTVFVFFDGLVSMSAPFFAGERRFFAEELAAGLAAGVTSGPKSLVFYSLLAEVNKRYAFE
jgi:hypothetical protein